MAVCDAHLFPGFLTPVLTQLFFPKPLTTFLRDYFCRGDKRKCAGKKVSLNRGVKVEPPGYESDTPTIKPPGRGYCYRLGVVVGVQKLTFCNISVITEDINLKLGVYIRQPKTNPYYKGKQFKISQLCPFFDLNFFFIFCDISVITEDIDLKFGV